MEPGQSHFERKCTSSFFACKKIQNAPQRGRFFRLGRRLQLAWKISRISWVRCRMHQSFTQAGLRAFVRPLLTNLKNYYCHRQKMPLTLTEWPSIWTTCAISRTHPFSTAIGRKTFAAWLSPKIPSVRLLASCVLPRWCMASCAWKPSAGP
jgi:hypothetical protein